VVESGLEACELLVVAFTEAAAAELRGRIGRRLQDALRRLTSVDVVPDVQGSAPIAPVDPVLDDWSERRDSLGPDSVSRDRGRLLLALEDLHRADITTVHGFCLRTL